MPVALPGAYERTVLHGKPLDIATVAALKECEAELGYELTITQGIGGAAASAGSHTEGRAVDLAWWDYERKVKVLKRKGFAVWPRPYLPGVWPAHIHAVLILNAFDNARGIAPVAFRQIGSYVRGRNGLANDAVDAYPWRPDPIPVYVYPPKKEPAVPPQPTKVTQARDALVEAMHALETAAAHLDDADPGRVVARGQIDDLHHLEQRARSILSRLPKR